MVVPQKNTMYDMMKIIQKEGFRDSIVVLVIMYILAHDDDLCIISNDLFSLQTRRKQLFSNFYTRLAGCE